MMNFSFLKLFRRMNTTLKWDSAIKPVPHVFIHILWIQNIAPVYNPIIFDWKRSFLLKRTKKLIIVRAPSIRRRIGYLNFWNGRNSLKAAQKSILCTITLILWVSSIAFHAVLAVNDAFANWTKSNLLFIRRTQN